FSYFFSFIVPLSLTSTLFPYTTLFRSVCLSKIGYRRVPAILASINPCFDKKALQNCSATCVERWLIPHVPGRNYQCSLLLVRREDRKSTRLNSSHLGISYAVFCLKKKK